MIPGIVEPLGGRLAERWAGLLVLPGLLFLAVAAIVAPLGHRRWRDLAAAGDRIDSLAGAAVWGTAGGVLLAAGGVLVLTTAAGLAARLLGAGTLRLWLAAWPAALHRLAAAAAGRRRRRWTALHDRFEAAVLAGADQAAQAPELAAARNRIAVAEPRRPTWMGDRLAAVQSRVAAAYGLDLVSCWPRAWLVVPETTRTELTAARAAVDRAATLAGWGSLYLLLGLLWWPAAVAGALTWLVAWRVGRGTVALFADLVESVFDLHAADVARAVGVDCPGPMTPATGREVTRRLRKGS